MLNYTIRRLLMAIPTLLMISFIIFIILDLAPNDPTGNLPMTIPPDVRERIKESLGLGNFLAELSAHANKLSSLSREHKRSFGRKFVKVIVTRCNRNFTSKSPGSRDESRRKPRCGQKKHGRNC